MAISNSTKARVKKLAASGNKAAQNYLRTGKVGSRNEQVTDSKGNALSIRRDSAGKAVGLQTAAQNDNSVINSEKMQPRPAITLPEPTVTEAPDYTSYYTGLTGGDTGVSTNGSTLTVAPVKDEFSGIGSAYEAYTKAIMGAQEERTSAADIQRKLERETGIKQLRQEVNDYASQLNTITAERDANILRVEGQGRGIPEAIIGGQQAQINKEAAIRALPVQAQLAAAQGNLQLAQDHINTWGKILMDDANNEYNFKKDLYASIRDFTVGIETAKLNKLEKENDRKYAEKTANNKTIIDLALQATEYGQTGLLGQIKRLNPESPTFTTDVASVIGQLRKPVAATKRDTAFDKDGNLVDMQTGEVVRAATSTDTPNAGLDGKPLTQAQQKVRGFADRLTEAEKVLTNSGKFASLLAVGAVLPNYLKTSDRQEYEQAKRNFVNAVLRTESGAVIADSEFANAEQQYFPQLGDSDAVVAQKAANRNTVINNFYREANVLRPVNAGDIIESGGVRYKVDDDGVTLIEL